MLCVAGCAAFMLLGFIMMRLEIYIPALFALVFGMVSASDCFIHGREYEIERRRDILAGKYRWEADSGDARCKFCNCREFYVVADHLVCVCCGTVMEHER